MWKLAKEKTIGTVRNDENVHNGTVRKPRQQNTATTRYREPERDTDEEDRQPTKRICHEIVANDLSLGDFEQCSPGPFQVITALSLTDTAPPPPEMEYSVPCIKRWLYVEVSASQYSTIFHTHLF